MKFVLTGLFLFAFCSAIHAGAPNFVWIIADDMSPDIGAYGLKEVSTPNLDKLAAEGRRYTRAYATAPVCSSSRSAFILGCYQTTTGLYPHDTEKPQPLPAPYQPLPELLRKAGWFVTNASAPVPAAHQGRVPKVAKTHYNFAHDSAQMYEGNDWRKRKTGQPFFAQFQVSEPHRPFPIPTQYDEAKLRAIQIPPNYPEHPLIRRDWYAYQRSVEMVDQRVGLILEQLKAEGVLDNTVVMFFADHGRPMPWGKQWLSVEGLQVPLIVRGPQILAGSVEERLVSLIDLAPSMLQLADRPIPAWMEGKAVLGGDFPERSMLFAARDRCGDAMDRIRAVIGTDALFVQNFHPELSRLNWSGYKESSYPGMPLLRRLQQAGKLDALQTEWLAPERREPQELYDLKTDPLGVRNIAKAPQEAARVTAMQTTLETWIQSSRDQGAHEDPPTEPPLTEIQKEKRMEYQRVWKTRLKKAEPSDAERVAWWEKSYGLSSDQPVP
ncbi:sulfatase [Prosthecobacter sp.]|uniref:sulfatase n=1 Tax=Prosthecobacter sp. TaxID=1965333 RepID=UPI0037851323